MIKDRLTPVGNGRTKSGESKEEDQLQKMSFKKNFVQFCIFYSVIHAAVDAVLAFSSAELGTRLGSLGGMVLYVFYTVSALFVAKPIVQILEAKRTVFLGLVGLLCYVGGFYLALLIPRASSWIFLAGCAIGGIGAGLLWTGQGTYYTLNAIAHAFSISEDHRQVITTFAGIFAGFYLSFETAFKFLGTLLFVVVGLSSSSRNMWRPALFGIYTTAAFLSTIFFWIGVQEFHHSPDNVVKRSESHARRSSDSRLQRRRLLSPPTEAVVVAAEADMALPTTSAQADEADALTSGLVHGPCQWSSVWEDTLAVLRAMVSHRKLQLLLPYQVCFGLSAGLVDIYVNGVVVKRYLGEGYIGLLAGLVTLSAALLAMPFSFIGNMGQGQGKGALMIVGAVCFALNGLMLLLLRDEQLASWPVIVLFYVIHGAARGIWENTNKAVVAEYFVDARLRDTAFASVYFSSGLAGAVGFGFFQFLHKNVISAVNVVAAVLALICFVSARTLHERDTRATEIRHVVAVLSTESPSSSDDEADDDNDIYGSRGQRSRTSSSSSLSKSSPPKQQQQNPLHRPRRADSAEDDDDADDAEEEEIVYRRF